MNRLDTLAAQSTWTAADVAEYETLLSEVLGLNFFTALIKMLK